MGPDQEKQTDRATRIICAKLYQGGLSSANSILNDILKRPLTGKNPEHGIDIDLIEVEAKKAVKYHLEYSILASIFVFMAIISFLLYDKSVSGLMILIAATVVAWKAFYLNRNTAIKNFSKLSLNSKRSLEGQVGSGKENQNVVIFGGYYPFLGAGIKTGFWDFVIDTSKPSKTLGLESEKPMDLSINELYEDASKKISSLGLPNVSDTWVLFADGNGLDKKFLRPKNPDDIIDYTDIDSGAFFSPEHKKYLDRIVGEPIENLNPVELFDEGHGELGKEQKTYYTIKYIDNIRGTLFTTFLRFSSIGKEIFAECSFYFLPPVDEDRYDIDKMPLFDELFIYRRGLMTAIVSSIVLLLVYLDYSYLVIPLVSLYVFVPILSFINGPYAKYILKKGLKQKSPFIWHVLQLFFERGMPQNYGNLITFREMSASSTYKNYYNSQDILLIKNSVEKAIVDSIADLLDSKNIDSSFLREGLLAVVNQGVIMYGGRLEADQVAVGKGAKTLKNKMSRKLSRSAKWVSKKAGGPQ